MSITFHKFVSCFCSSSSSHGITWKEKCCYYKLQLYMLGINYACISNFYSPSLYVKKPLWNYQFFTKLWDIVQNAMFECLRGTVQTLKILEFMSFRLKSRRPNSNLFKKILMMPNIQNIIRRHIRGFIRKILTLKDIVFFYYSFLFCFFAFMFPVIMTNGYYSG